MNILITANYSAQASGNFIGSLMDLGKYLKNKGDRLLFVFPKNIKTTGEGSWTHWLEREGFKVFLIEKGLSRDDQLKYLKKLIIDQKIDILHDHFGLFQYIVTHFRGQLSINKVIIHERMEYPAGYNHFKQSIKYAARSAYFRIKGVSIISVNQKVDAAHLFAEHYYVPNGISFSRNVEHSLSREECRKKLGFGSSDKVVLFLGWKVYTKGLDIAVKAVNECRKIDPNIFLGIIGIGNPPIEDRMNFIKEKTGISPNEPWIRYLPSTEDMYAYHRAVDTYLSSSRSEAFSNGLLEAISQNIPVVVSNIKGTSWALEFDRSYSYPVEDYKACADKILSALDDKTVISNSREIIDRYSIDKWCAQIYKIYHS